MNRLVLSFFAAICVCLGGSVVWADVQPHSLICDGMVMQQDMEVPIWGWADNGEKIAVEFNGQTVKTEAKDGKWMVRLNPMDSGGPFTMTIRGKNTLKLNNILIGEVWICSGQSNMQWPVRASNNAEEEITNAKHPKIHLFTVPRVVAGKSQSNVDGEWVECGPDTVPNFSAVGYFFGRELHNKLGVPIGLIHSSWGGTPAESWTTRETLANNPELKPVLERWDRDYEKFVQELDQYSAKLDQWLQETNVLDKRGELIPDFPKLPRDPRRHPWRPSGLYNAMIAPLIPYAIQGAIWYQGESNAQRAYQYRELFPAMIKDWREQWGQGDFPFLFVQLANFEYNRPPETAWPELREAQLKTLSLPNTGMAVTIDIGDPNDIHPRNKQDVGKRLALAAMKIAYGKDVVYSGPIYESMEIKDQEIKIDFKHTGSGLTTPDGQRLKGFEIAGKDKKFIPGDAKIVGDSVVVSHDSIKEPVAVRYGWHKNPDCNLYNEEGLPASPFRTDGWPAATRNER